MTHVYVVGSALMADFEAELDDPSIREGDLEDFAAPQVHAVYSVLGAGGPIVEAPPKIRAEIENRIRDLYEEAEMVLTWDAVDHIPPTGHSRESWIWRVRDERGDLLAAVVMHKIEAEVSL